HLDPDRRQRRLARQAADGQVRQGDPRGARRVGAVGGQPVRGARLPGLQDQRQAQRPGDHGPRLRAAQRGLRLSAAPRGHRGRPGLPGDDQVGRRLRRPALQGHRRHHPRVPLGPAGRGGQGRHPDPAVAEPPPPQARDRLLPVLRAGPGRRLQAGRGGHRRARGDDRPAPRRRHGLRRQRPGGGPRGRPGRRLRQRQGTDLRPRRGGQDRPRGRHRRDADRGGAAAGRVHAGGRGRPRGLGGRRSRAGPGL
ncbi:MAG: (E)-4-hydroxy-3-methylbut-2-enyl-diphosphate synthase (flavodoxin), partial [uncultured Friedmanniella sp.]